MHHQLTTPPPNIQVPRFPCPNTPDAEYQYVLEEAVIKTFSFPIALNSQDLTFRSGGIVKSKHHNSQDELEKIAESYKRYTTYKYLDHYHIFAYNQKEKKYEVFEVKAP